MRLNDEQLITHLVITIKQRLILTAYHVPHTVQNTVAELISAILTTTLPELNNFLRSQGSHPEYHLQHFAFRIWDSAHWTIPTLYRRWPISLYFPLGCLLLELPPSMLKNTSVTWISKASVWITLIAPSDARRHSGKGGPGVGGSIKVGDLKKKKSRASQDDQRPSFLMAGGIAPFRDKAADYRGKSCLSGWRLSPAAYTLC